MAGHDNNYLALAGMLHTVSPSMVRKIWRRIAVRGTLDFFRRGNEKPFPPANFAGDYAPASSYERVYLDWIGLVLRAVGRRMCELEAGGAMMLALGVLLVGAPVDDRFETCFVSPELELDPQALVERSRSGRGQVIDAAMVDGANYTVLSLCCREACIQLTVHPSRHCHFSSGCNLALFQPETRLLHVMTACRVPRVTCHGSIDRYFVSNRKDRIYPH